MTEYVVAFIAGVAVDLLYAVYIATSVRGQPGRAALASMGIGGCGLLGVSGVVTNPWLAAPYLLGLGIGTFVGVRRPS